MQQSSLSSSGKQLAAGQQTNIRQKSTKDCGAEVARLLGFDLLLNGALQKMEEEKGTAEGLPWLMDREKLVKLLLKQPSWA